MLSLYVRPLTFDNKKNEILFSQHNIEWKKQVATVSLKKGLTSEAFMNEKILPKIGNNVYVFAKFKYIPEDEKPKDIFLVCNENKIIANTDLYFESHIPRSESVTILESRKKNIVKTAKYIRIKGEALAFCVDVASYYLDEINLDEYIEFVQADPMDVANSEDLENSDSEVDADPNDDPSNSEEDESDLDDDLDDDDELDDPDDPDLVDDLDDDLDDELEDDVKEGDDVDDQEEGDDVDIDEDDVDDVDDVDDEDDDEAEAEVEEEAVDDENGIPGGGDIGDGEEDEPPAPKTSNKRKKPGSSKSIKFSTGIDMSVIFNILKPEDQTKIIPESQLHLKRQINLKIFKLLDLPFKTIQMLEKGIYNYVIEKCNSSFIIPIWDNPEFMDIYVSKSKSLYSNLNTKCYVGNKGLLDKIKKGKINAYDVPFLDAYKLYPEKWNDIIEEKTKMEKILKESLKESATDLFQCPRCHKRKTIYCEVQTRSSDEPMTKFITCLECGCKWKKY
jgi:DNA-directed RNA polymerase subunit M/transcription elongation factor TFIIS